MEVIRSSDIARLVLGYLRDNNLEKTAKSFCKSSPYLREEYKLIRKGYRWVSLGSGSLTNILLEYCEIKSKVVQLVESLPVEAKDRFTKQCNILAQISIILKAAKRELAEKIGVQEGSLKRRISNGSDKHVSFETTQEHDLPGYSPISVPKRRRISDSLLFLSGNKSQELNHSSDDEGSASSRSQSRSSEPETVISLLQPSKHNKIEDVATNREAIQVPSFPSISETLLENTEFQNKLVANINKVLSIAPPLSAEKNITTAKKPNSELPSDEVDFQFEEMIKNILNATENDPTFNEVVQDIVLSNASLEPRPATSNQSTQCSPQQTALEPVASTSSYEPSLKDRLRSRKANSSSEILTETAQNLSPKTPGKFSIDSDLKIESFLADPNFSLSKLIVLNPDDTITTSTPLISDSLLGSTANQILNSYGENIFIDANTGMSIPLYMTNDGQAVYFNTEIPQQQPEENLLCARLAEPPVENIDLLSQGPIEQLNKNNLEDQASMCVPNIDRLNHVASLDSSRICGDKETPLAHIASTELIRSFSTPRRRASHVRILNFSTPPKLQSDGDKATVHVPESLVQPIILACDNQIPIIGENVIIGDESSNSSTNGFTKASSEVTVIQQNISETPKRTSNGRRSCVRMLSRSANEKSESLTKKKEKLKGQRKKKSPPKKDARKTKLPPNNIKKPKSAKKVAQEEQTKTQEETEALTLNTMEEWQKLRSIVPGQWDQHLREMSANARKNWQSSHSNKKRKRKIGENKSEVNLNSSSSSIDEDDSMKSNSIGDGSESSVGKRSAKKSPINFKFVMLPKSSNDLISSKSPGKNERKNELTLEKIIEPTVDIEPNEFSVVPVEQKSTQGQPKDSKALLENRTNNMALLLDTPFKIDAAAIPITPRFLVPGSNDTPITKMMNSFRGQISMCKNPDMPTPNCAITPGAGLTPIEKDTPRSGYRSSYTTDYSSGGSYYKPDESDDLDRHFDKLLTVERTTLKLKAKETSVIEPASHDVPEILPEDSSSQSVVTVLNTSTEIREQQIDCAKILEKIQTPKKLTAPSNYTFREGLSENTTSNNSSSSSDSSSSSSSTSSSSHSSDSSHSDVSWVEPDPIEKSEDEINEKSEVPQLVAENGKVRYPLRSSVTPKKTETRKSSSTSPTNNRHMVEVVEKIKMKTVAAQQKQTKQITDLEAKRLRMKHKLQNDFSINDNKRPVQTAAKTTRVTRHTKKKELIEPTRTDDQHANTRDEIDVLKALNLLVKKPERPNSASSATHEIFVGEEFPKRRADDDSKDSADTKEIRNAARVLSNLSKGAAETVMDSKSLEKPAIIRNSVRKGRPRKSSSNNIVKTTSQKYPPQKPVTRRDSKNIKNEPLQTSRKPEMCAIAEFPGKSIDSPNKLEIKTAQSLSPKTLQNKMLTRPEELEPNISQDKPTMENRLVDAHLLESSSSDQDEDEDPYDACESLTIDETDNLRYHHIMHESPSPREVKSKPTLRHTQDLSSMVMNVFLKGELHQLVVTDEIELFANMPMTRKERSAAVVDEKKHGKLEASRKKQRIVTARGKKRSADKLDEIDADDPFDRQILSPVQPKINIKYKAKTIKKDDKTKLKTEINKDINKNESRTAKLENRRSPKESSTASNTVTALTSTTPPEASKPIKNEDINAVLSHLYGSACS